MSCTDDHSGCDIPVHVTMFPDLKARQFEPNQLTLRQLYDQVAGTFAPHKAALPLVKLATFGAEQTEKGSLRHDANLMGVSGVEGDYDGGEVWPWEAADRLRQEGLAALIYTTPGHTAEAPRWRVLVPLAQQVTPAEREALCARLNGALGGILAPESFSRTQSYYFGRVTGRSFESILVEGQPLDRVTGVAPIGPQSTPVKSTTDLSDQFRAQADRAEVQRALECITDADDRHTWLQIGMALKHEFGDCADAFDLWSRWSRQSLKFDARKQRRTWNSFQRGGVGIGTLFQYAKGPCQQTALAPRPEASSGLSTSR